MSQTDPLYRNQFLINLASTFHVKSIPLAIFILIITCGGCIGALILLIMCVKYSLRRKYIKKSQKRRLKSVYLDELASLEDAKGEYGQLTYMLEYEVTTKTLRVIIGEAKDFELPPDTKTLDVYATLRVAMAKHGKWEQLGKSYKTEVKRRTNFPRWHYQCDYEMSEDDLKYAQLIFEVFDYDSIGQDKSIGRLDVPLSTIDPTTFVGGTIECRGWLKRGEPKYEGLGELSTGLTYNARTERIEIHLYEARQLKLGNLVSEKKNHQIYVSVEFRIKRRTVGNFESSHKSELVNPYFNEKANFPLKEKDLPDAGFVCYLKKHGRMGRRRILGFLTIGPKAELTSGSKHWEEMIHNSPRTHIMWHTWTPKD